MSRLPHKLSDLSQADNDKVLAARFQHQEAVLRRIHTLYGLHDCLLIPGCGCLEVVLRDASRERLQGLAEDLQAIAWDAWIGLGLEEFQLKHNGRIVSRFAINTLSKPPL